MTDLNRLKQALIKADAAGETEDARIIAKEIRRIQSERPVDAKNRIDSAFDASAPEINQASVSARDIGVLEGSVNALRDSGEVGKFLVDRGRSIGSDISAAVDGVSNMLTFGTDDEIEAGLASGFGVTGNFDDALNVARTRRELNEIRSPAAKVAGQLAGGALTGTGLAKKGLLASVRLAPNAGITARTTAAGIDGAVAGGLAGAGNAEENRGQAAIQGAIIGAGTGAIVGQALSRVQRSKIAKQKLPVTNDIKAAAQSLYKEAEDAGVKFSQGFYNRLAPSARNAAGRTHSGLHPKTQAALEVLENERGRVLSLPEIDEVRQVINNARAGADPADARLLGKIVDRIDSFIENPRPADFVQGSQGGVGYLKEARRLWQKQAKSQVIDDIVEKAQNQASGFENGLRVQFRSLANNPKRFRQFNAAEQKAIKKIVRGGPIENSLKAIGWLDPRGVFGALLTGGTVTGVGALPGAALATTGYAGRKAAEAATRGNVNNLQRIVNTGTGNVALPAPTAAPGVLSQITGQGSAAIPLLPATSNPRGR